MARRRLMSLAPTTSMPPRSAGCRVIALSMAAQTWSPSNEAPRPVTRASVLSRPSRPHRDAQGLNGGIREELAPGNFERCFNNATTEFTCLSRCGYWNYWLGLLPRRNTTVGNRETLPRCLIKERSVCDAVEHWENIGG